MNPSAAIVLVAGCAVVFFSAVSSRAPRWLPRPAQPQPREYEAGRALHRFIVLHLAVVAAGCALFVAPLGEEHWIAPVYLGALLVVRWIGAALSRRIGAGTGVVQPVLAPLQGAAYLVEWAVAPLLRLRAHADPGAVERNRAQAQVRELTSRTVEQVMIPRSEVAWVPASAGIPEIAETLRKRPHSTIPVFDGDFEQYRGMIDLTDLLEPLAPGAKAGDLARAGRIVPETMGCDDLVRAMRIEGYTTAVVVDEFGAMAGLITLEDLLEVLLGELSGEHEATPVRVRQLENGTYLVDASLRIDEFEEAFGHALPQGDYETIAGLFLCRVAHIPEVGERIDVGPFRFEVAEASPRRIGAFRVSGVSGSISTVPGR